MSVPTNEVLLETRKACPIYHQSSILGSHHDAAPGVLDLVQTIGTKNVFL